MTMNVPLHPGVPTVRHVPVKQVSLPNGLVPLIDSKDPDRSKVQEVWNTKVGQFVLGDPEQLKEINRIWQLVTDGGGIYCENDYQTVWSESKQSFISFLRWTEYTYVAPKD